jgi:hypothetical protein
MVKWTVNNLSFFVVIHNVFVLIDSNSSPSLTIQNETYVRVKFFSYNYQYHQLSNISFSSWITVCTHTKKNLVYKEVCWLTPVLH